MTYRIANLADAADLAALGFAVSVAQPGRGAKYRPRPPRKRDLTGLTPRQILIEERCEIEEDLSGIVHSFCARLRKNGFRIRAYHAHDSRKSEFGFPDWSIVIPGWQYKLELKVLAELTPDQDDWLALYRTLPNCTAMVVRPRDWPDLADDILERLTNGTKEEAPRC